MELDLFKLRASAEKSTQMYIEENIPIDTRWDYGIFVFGVKPEKKLNKNYGFSTFHKELYTSSGEKINEATFYIPFDEELVEGFKQGYLTSTFNQIEIEIKNKEFISYKRSWNQNIIDDFNKNRNFSQPYRAKYNGAFKPWYLDKGNYIELPDQELSIADTVKIDSFASLTNYLKSIAVTTKDRWDCTFLTFQISDYSSISTVKKEEYVYLTDQDPERDKPHAFIQEIKFSSENLKKIFEGFKIANLWDAYTVEFQLKADGTFDYYVLDGYKKWINGRDVDPKSYEAFEKEMAEGLNEELNQSDQPITSDYLLQNIYGCISANVPDDFASIEAIITRSFEGDIQQVSGSYSYKPKGLFSSSKSVEPGEQIYPINVTIRLLDEFYTEQSKDWSKAVLTFKNDGTCNVKIGK